MDHYKVLGLHRNATKDEIKESFRKLAIKYHPDKHSHSSKSVRDDATLRFKRLSEAYQVLIDDRKRSDYNLRTNYHATRAGGRGGSTSTSSTYGSGYSSSYRGDYGWYQKNYAYSSGNKDAAGFFASKVEALLRLMTTRAFLLNAAFAGVLFGASAVLDSGREALWKMQNPGKSFEEAMESIEKAKARRE